MGIRFQCPNGHKLNVKADLAGKRASCPECGVKLVIPAADTGARAPMSGGWHMRMTNGEQLGPTTNEEFSKLIAAGRVTADSHIWREGWAEWRLARDAADDLPTPLAAVPIPTTPVAPPAVPPAANSPEPELAEAPVAEPVVPLTAADPNVGAEKTAMQPPPSDPIIPDATALAASNYAIQRRRTKQKQLALTIVMFVTVVVLAAVLIWVLRNNVSSAPQSLRTDNLSSFITSAENG